MFWKYDGLQSIRLIIEHYKNNFWKKEVFGDFGKILIQLVLKKGNKRDKVITEALDLLL